jgi:hypothetical protein
MEVFLQSFAMVVVGRGDLHFALEFKHELFKLVVAVLATSC